MNRPGTGRRARPSTLLSIAALAIVAHGCGGGASGGLLKGRYFYDQGCAEGVHDAVSDSLLLADGLECAELAGEEQVSPDYADRAERSLDGDEREHARGYVDCFISTFDDLYPAMAAARWTVCPVGQEEACGIGSSDPSEWTWNIDAFEFIATETCPGYANQRPLCPTVTVEQGYQHGLSDGADCLTRDREARSASEERTWQRGCNRMAYDAGWVVGRVTCLDRTDGWRDAPEEDEQG
jgi:hypothetical protein